MAKYTIELHSLIELGYQLPLNNYPIFDEDYRKILNDKIISHFYFREIGLETPDRFAFFLARKMNEIMPLYNQYYMSERIKFNPLFSDYFEKNIDSINEMRKDNENYTKSNIHSENGSTLTSNIDRHNSQNIDDIGAEKGSNQYTKNGGHKIDFTREIHEETDQTTDRNIDKDTTLKSDITENNLKTNNLSEVTNASENKDTTFSSNKSGTEIFSDIPQAGIETVTVQSPDGTITTTTKGYATTKTDTTETLKSQENVTDTKEQTTKNTGTVNIDDTKNQNDNEKTIQTEHETLNKETLTNETSNESKEWDEKGNDNSTIDRTANRKIQDATNQKEDAQQNSNSNSKLNSNFKENTSQNTNMYTKILNAGRTSISPSKLLLEFRNTFMNIDMLIINELEELFMEVF